MTVAESKERVVAPTEGAMEVSAKATVVYFAVQLWLSMAQVVRAKVLAWKMNDHHS
jgi:hypothetical protein